MKKQTKIHGSEFVIPLPDGTELRTPMTPKLRKAIAPYTGSPNKVQGLPVKIKKIWDSKRKMWV